MALTRPAGRTVRRAPLPMDQLTRWLQVWRHQYHVVNHMKTRMIKLLIRSQSLFYVSFICGPARTDTQSHREYVSRGGKDTNKWYWVYSSQKAFRFLGGFAAESLSGLRPEHVYITALSLWFSWSCCGFDLAHFHIQRCFWWSSSLQAEIPEWLSVVLLFTSACPCGMSPWGSDFPLPGTCLN